MFASLTRTHSVPVFDGERSRHHRDVPVWKLRLRAGRQRIGGRGPNADGASFAQFVGFPRSGHSLIGAILDAHPQALVAHELDVMGLIDKGLSRSDICALVAHNSEEFSRHGRYWNGFRYAVAAPSRPRGNGAALRVIGDKKGDWVARHVAANPALLDVARRRLGSRCKWILVVRDPWDNVATMSLRKGGLYDRLRIECPDSAAFRAALRERQADGGIAATALDSMIDDYRGLCRSVEAMKARIDPADWHEVHYEGFTADPGAGIRALLGFLDLPADDGFVADAATIVRHSGRRSRDDLVWRDDQRAAMRALVGDFSFLRRYGGDG